ncbi:hypothetical protein [Streptomyces cucumeris]|nr:hypothetical protein [Streptomyces sp. NEAU-Y11]
MQTPADLLHLESVRQELDQADTDSGTGEAASAHLSNSALRGGS